MLSIMLHYSIFHEQMGFRQYLKTIFLYWAISTERSADVALLMEWYTTAVLSICQEILPRCSGQLVASFLKLHDNLSKIQQFEQVIFDS